MLGVSRDFIYGYDCARIYRERCVPRIRFHFCTMSSFDVFASSCVRENKIFSKYGIFRVMVIYNINICHVFSSTCTIPSLRSAFECPATPQYSTGSISTSWYVNASFSRNHVSRVAGAGAFTLSKMCSHYINVLVPGGSSGSTRRMRTSSSPA